jgi:hypothetical protein
MNSERPRSSEHAALGVLALLPIAVLAWPFAGSPVRTTLEPAVVGAAVLALALLPAVGYAVVTRRAPAAIGLSPLFAYVLASFVSRAISPPTDTLEADRATLIVL